MADSDFCPHCNGSLRAQVKRLQHECFEDATHSIIVNGKRRRPTKAMWRVLTALRERPGRIVAKGFLAQESALNPEDGGDENSLRVRITHLRKMMRGTPFAIASIYSEGYGIFPVGEVTRKMSNVDSRSWTRPRVRGLTHLSLDDAISPWDTSSTAPWVGSGRVPRRGRMSD